ncbi:Aldo/keto reductase [Didymella exigua CBS 183.55]|uniref:Aldo/keto reductase n=1 Tax=Didymella exigua CBS 183.55 TaxID=1150837 RepID=A0A6A5RNI4_9PLEO|nr:Aldo/keto reductase [Didymella exigua CBS 183.55]KAF1928698.1 Aldo/keto reductase [Didymella exigua CBS 183.55]
MSLPTAQLGRDGPQVNRLGFGLMGLSSFYGKPRPDDERLDILTQAHKLGERFWDSSDIYGDSEVLLGKWFAANKDKRNNIFLATKFAIDPKTFQVDSSPEYAKKACNASLERLGLSQIDLYYCHRVDGRTPIEKTVEAMAELKKEGKIRYLGLSEISSDTLRRAHAVHPITAVQVEYSPFALEIESKEIDLLATCRELGVAVVAYSPLCRGILGGALKSADDFASEDYRSQLPRFSPENFPKNLKLVDQIIDLAKKKNVEASQLTLAWLLKQGEDVFPIPGTTKVDRLKENLGSLDVKLSQEEEQQIRKACEEADVAGDRYSARALAQCYGDTPALK